MTLTQEERVALTFIAHNDPRDGFVRRTWLEFKTAICGLLQRTRSNGWIPVSERLPEDDQQCLTVDKDGVQRVARFDAIGDGERHSWYEEQEWTSVYPVAWMPLPEPPEVK